VSDSLRLRGEERESGPEREDLLLFLDSGLADGLEIFSRGFEEQKVETLLVRD